MKRRWKMKVIKEFWVTNEHLDKINKNEETAVIIRNKDESNFNDSVTSKAINKITITYEVDREITIKESDIDRLLSDRSMGFFEKDIELIKKAIFGDK